MLTIDSDELYKLQLNECESADYIPYFTLSASSASAQNAGLKLSR
jgi:hypothetical protein